MNIKSGDFKHKIEIQIRKIKADEMGIQTEEWQTYYNCYCSVNNLHGSEYWNAAQQNKEDTKIFTTRWYKLLDNIDSQNYRIIFRNRAYDIVQVDNVQYLNQIVKLKAQLQAQTQQDIMGCYSNGS